MTQHEMFPTGPKITGVVIELHDLTVTDLEDAITIQVRQAYSDGHVATVWHGKFTGVMVDFVDTLLQDTAHAWLWGKAGDVARALGAVERQARRHHKHHTRLGG